MCAGMHGGRIYVRGEVAPEQLGPEAALSVLTEDDDADVRGLLDDFKAAFKMEVPDDLSKFVKIAPSSSRPFSGYYDKTNI
ncbi:MAG: hypothetical protein NT131_07010 [Methanomassiliicoccales archaeon]|nr:hypothetical protein [Methanomassiliicoccales archaeon]